MNKMAEVSSDVKKGSDRKMKIVWRNVILMFALHGVSLFTLTILHQMLTLTIAWGLLCFVISALGITAGAHRLWAHKSYKAKLPLRILLALFNSMAFQNSILNWAREHRTHHKFSETDADPHNSNRGFFFSHIGWLLVRKHPDVARKGKGIDLSDLHDDSVVMFQNRYYLLSVLLLCFVVPIAVPMYWGETFLMSYLMCLLRYCLVLNCTWMVNSVAHMWGYRPYDKNINPAENMVVAFLATGEGYHNYHHVFPYDYSTSEYGIKLNLTTTFIDTMALIGLATHRRKVSPEIIQARKKRTGQ
uniref:Acyl-CoA desaturase-like n=1 Tax=Phallusia mammillata TaxID=59560 RepID=A0A6F9DS96_9ASCI|nr:acyl-CoA desaturase-like [Phallusia mammillata]